MEREVPIRDVFTREYVGVSESDTVRDAAGLMRDERVSSVLVLRGRDPVGIATEWDVLGVVADGEDPGETPVGAVMSSPVISMDADRSLSDAAATMSTEGIRNMVVRAGDEVLGLLTERDVIAATATLNDAAGASPGPNPDAGGATQGIGEPGADGGEAEYATQSICERCGTLADALWEVNGQLLCTDCRAV